MPKPEPVPTTIVCSECGLAWGRHEKATLAECVRLLKADLHARPLSYTTLSNVTPIQLGGGPIGGGAASAVG